MLYLYNKKNSMEKTNTKRNFYDPERIIDVEPKKKIKRWRVIVWFLGIYLLLLATIRMNWSKVSEELAQNQEKIATIIETRKELKLWMSAKISDIQTALASLSWDVQTVKALNEQEEELSKLVKDYESKWVPFDDFSDLFTKLRDELKLLVNDWMKKD